MIVTTLDPLYRPNGTEPFEKGSLVANKCYPDLLVMVTQSLAGESFHGVVLHPDRGSRIRMGDYDTFAKVAFQPYYGRLTLEQTP